MRMRHRQFQFDGEQKYNVEAEDVVLLNSIQMIAIRSRKFESDVQTPGFPLAETQIHTRRVSRSSASI
jgi:hypothetical protein